MKKKILTVALVLALIAIMVSGTLAYFTDKDEVTNTFTIGSVKIEIYENGEATPEDTKPLGKLVPVVKPNPSEDKSYIKKVVHVKNVGANDAYIRTHLAIPTKLIDYLMLDLNLSADGWSQVGTATVTGDYTVYTYDYASEVAPNSSTAELLKGVYLASDVDLEEDSLGSLWFVKKTEGQITHRSNFLAHQKTAAGYTSTTVNVMVASEAIQAQGFENGATNALNSGFDANTNPWQ